MFTLDSYAASGCPLKVHHAFHPGLVRPVTPIPSRPTSSTEFRASVLDSVAAGEASVADLRPLTTQPSAVQETACLEAMAAGTEVVICGLLPRDWEAHRAGRPDLLVRNSTGGYSPGLIRNQRVVDARKDELPFAFSELTDLPRRQVSTGWRYRWHWRWANALQLAHLWRLLGPTGHQAAEPTALVVGTDDSGGPGPRAAWLDLAEPAVPPSIDQLRELDPEGSDQAHFVTALDRYDHEFSLRVELAELAGAANPDDPPLQQPIVRYECTFCPWWTLCRAQLDDDDLSLRIRKSRLDTHEIEVLREAGVGTVGALATKDLDALLPEYLPQVAHRTGAELRLRLAQRRSRLLLDGVELERTTTGPIAVPAAPLEVDIDVETSRDDRVYLWGFWVSEAGSGSYHEFSRFSEFGETEERDLARSAMNWLRTLVSGREALVFHYSDYEVVRLGRLAEPGDEVMDWATAFAAEHFVDLFPIIREHFFGTNGLGLKTVASAGAGFSWRDEDPGGLNSMGWFDEAVHARTELDRERARTRVLEYNEDDVKATWHLRRWLRELGQAPT